MWKRNVPESVTWLLCSKQLPISRDVAKYLTKYLFDWVLHLAIVGWRGFNNRIIFNGTLAAFVATYGTPTLVISGGAIGADTMGEEWAKFRGIPTMILKPEWKRYGKAAGPMRNTDIVAACTHMVAFPRVESGKGTQDAIRKAQQAGKILMIKKI